MGRRIRPVFRENLFIATQAFSEFITNREQGDWAEDLLFRAIQEISRDIVPVRYGRTDKIRISALGVDSIPNLGLYPHSEC